jgi:hypothetical protein
MDTAAAARAFLEHGLSPSHTQALGESLAPTLQIQLAPHLGDIHWFRADWQRGGAATGFSTWTRSDGHTVEAMVKLPVGYREFFWTTRLGNVGEPAWHTDRARALPTPRLLASGDTLNGYDLAWIVVEKLAGPPMSRRRARESIEAILATTAEFQARAASVKRVDELPSPHDWESSIRKSREAVRRGDCPDEQHWSEALKKVSRHLDTLVARWNARPLSAWCHGDLHPANALRRASAIAAPDPNLNGTPGENSNGHHPPTGRCVLIDLALVHAGHWSEDALYLERQHWGHEEFLFGVNPVDALADDRRRLGLEVEHGFHRWADLRRVLTAASAPGLIGLEGNARYLGGSLAVLTRLLRSTLA